MNSPQDRIVKKMIDNIVEQNKPAFERPAAAPAAPAAASAAPAAMNPEDYNLISRKLEYGFSNLRSDNAELRKAVEDLSGVVKMLRNDVDNLRASMRSAHAPAPQREEPVNAPPTAMGAPQYRKTEADEAFEAKGAPREEQPQQARGFAKKDPAADAGVDISKVFYYGKK